MIRSDQIKPICFAVMAALVLGAGSAQAQTASVPFGGLSHDASLPVELSADVLELDQQNGMASARGSVLIGQGDLRIGADTLEVTFASEGGQNIQQMVAEGNVTLTNGGEAAEAVRALYVVADGQIVLSGDVILTQGANALSANQIVIDLNTGQAQVMGRVRTILQSGGN